MKLSALGFQLSANPYFDESARGLAAEPF